MGGKGGYMERKLHGVIIEWDGVEVPSRWYSWLEGLTGFRVRDRDTHQPLQAFTPRSVIPDAQIREHLKDLETPEEVDSPESVFAKRANDFGGIAQEGAIIVASYSLARLLFFILDRGVPVTIRKTKETVYIRPANVYLMEIKVKETVARLPADEAALRRVENTIGKRGRKPPVAWWAVTCYEDMTTYPIEAPEIVRCPHCGGQHIRARSGTLGHYADPGGDVLTAWGRTRFGQGHWEYAGEGSDLAPELGEIKDGTERAYVDALATSPLLTQISHLSRGDQFAILDAALTARTRWLEERREEARANALAAYMLRGGSILDVEVAEGDPDLFDAAGPLGETFVAQLMVDYVKRHEALQVA